MVPVLLQPRHVYAPDPETGEQGHVYMPTSLMTAAARIMAAGVSVRLVDENITPATSLPPVVGVNLVGAPYVQRGRQLIERLQADHERFTILLGGQVVSGLASDQLTRLFGGQAVDGNNDRVLASALGVDSRLLPAAEETSLVPVYEQVPDVVMRLYLSREFAFYLSQGCRFACTFCAAERSHLTRALGTVVRVRERFRSPVVVDRDLRYLVCRASRLGLSALQLYLSNLDLFQTPSALREFASTVCAIRSDNPGFEIRMRGLSTSHSFLEAEARDPALVADLVNAGLYRVGFGIDGATPRVWRAVHKPHTSDTCLNAIRIARECYGLTPEALMVFGHVGVDDASSLALAAEFLEELGATYSAIPRPHVAKAVVPGNDGWRDPGNASTVDYLLARPTAFQLLDFTALPSRLTHADPTFRELVTAAFLRACGVANALTQYVYPEDPELPSEELEAARLANLRRYDV